MKKGLLFTTVSTIALGIYTTANAYDLTADSLGQSKNITWEEVSATGDDVITVSTPDGDKFFKYTYTIPTGYTEVTDTENRIENPSENIENKVFKDIVSNGDLFAKDPYYSYYGGGVIFNNENNEIIDITSDFTNNAIERTGLNNQSYGGAILNTSKLNNVTGDFIKNVAATKSGYASDAAGGAIANFDTINSIKSDFIGNFASSQSTDAAGGAIFNSGTIGNLTSNFIGNYANSESGIALGGVIYNGYKNTIKNLSGNFIGNYAITKAHYGHGGVMYNYGVINNISGNFIGNHLNALASSSSYYSQGGAIANVSTIDKISATFIGNYISSDSGTAQGGAIYNSYKIGNIINSNFFDNYVSGGGSTGGGAIYSNYDLMITADNGTSEFTGNYVEVNGTTTPNAIYMASQSRTLTLNAQNAGQILFNDEINGVEGYKIALNGDNTGTIDFKNNILNADILLENTNANLYDVAYLNNNNKLTTNSGKFNIVHLGLNDHLTANAITLNGGVLNFAEADVDLQAKKMGTINGDVLSITDGLINVDKMLISKDGDEGETRVDFIIGDNIPEATATVGETLAPLYKYEVSYDSATGEFVFIRSSELTSDSISSTPIRPFMRSYKAFNPGVFTNDVFAMSNLNTQGVAVKEILNRQQVFDYSKARIWATPFYSDDTIEYNGFYDIDSKSYGLIAGVDSKAYALGKNWTSVYTLFGAYNDGESKYQGVKVDSRSWLVGLKASVYNGGFYGDALVNYAWHDSDQTTAFGKDSVDSTGYGAALKAGYKHEFENKLELDTSAMLSWQEVQGEDFTSKSGARISTDDYSRLTLTPQVKLGYSFEKVKPYALVRYNFVLDEDGSSTVNNIALPTIESKDYVEYGLGLETTDTFPHSGFAHVLRHDGGRDGWSVTAGYKYNF